MLLGVSAGVMLRYKRLRKRKGKKWVGSYRNFVLEETREDTLWAKTTGLRVRDCMKMVDKTLRNSKSKIVFRPLPIDDPVRRCPDLAKAKKLLNWEPTTSLREGLMKTIAWFKNNEQKER